MFLFRPYFQNFTNLILKQSHLSLFRPSIPIKTKSVSNADQTDDMAAISHAISLISCFKLKIQTINKKWVFFFFLFFFFFELSPPNAGHIHSLSATKTWKFPSLKCGGAT